MAAIIPDELIDFAADTAEDTAEDVIIDALGDQFYHGIPSNPFETAGRVVRRATQPLQNIMGDWEPLTNADARIADQIARFQAEEEEGDLLEITRADQAERAFLRRQRLRRILTAAAPWYAKISPIALMAGGAFYRGWRDAYDPDMAFYTPNYESTPNIGYHINSISFLTHKKLRKAVP